MAKLIEITGKALSGEWGSEDENGIGIPILRTTNFFLLCIHLIFCLFSIIILKLNIGSFFPFNILFG